MQPPRSDSIWTWPFAILMLTGFLGYGSFYLTLPILPGYIQQLGGSEAQVGMILGIFSATALLVRPWSGYLSDRLGARTVVLMGIAGLGAGAAAYLPTHSVAAVLSVRILHGLGWGLFSAAAATVAAQLAPPSRRGAALSVWGIAGSAGLALGPVVGTALGPGPAAFLTGAAAAGVGVVLAACLPGRRAPGTGKGEPPRLSRLISREAFLPSVILLVHMATYGAVIGFIPVLTAERGIGNSGWFFTVYALALFGWRSLTGHLSDLHGRLTVIGPGLLVGSAALAGLAVTHSRFGLAAAAVLYAAATAAIQPIALAWATDRAGAGERGAAIATVIAAQDLGISAGSSAAGLIAGSAGLMAVFATASALALLGAVPVFRMARRPALGATPARTDEGAVR